MHMRSDLNSADWSRLRIRGRDPVQRPQMAEGPHPSSAGLTPVNEFFIVHHYPPAEVQPGTWSLEVKGRRGSKTLVLSDLHKLPERSVTALIECAGMSRGLLPEARLGTQFGHGMVGTARWTGVRLRDVLE